MSGPYRWSRSTDEANAPLVFHWAVVGGDGLAVQRELLRDVRNALREEAGSRDPAALREAWAAIVAATQRIAGAEARDGRDILNIERDRNLFEVRVQIDTRPEWARSTPLPVRIYITEPTRAPRTVVALHGHVKGTEGDVVSAQNAHIDTATRRWVEGEKTLWGLP